MTHLVCWVWMESDDRALFDLLLSGAASEAQVLSALSSTRVPIRFAAVASLRRPRDETKQTTTATGETRKDETKQTTTGTGETRKDETKQTTTSARTDETAANKGEECCGRSAVCAALSALCCDDSAAVSSAAAAAMQSRGAECWRTSAVCCAANKRGAAFDSALCRLTQTLRRETRAEQKEQILHMLHPLVRAQLLAQMQANVQLEVE